MMNKAIKSLTFGVLLSCSAQVSLAQERGEMLQKLFSRMDKNADGLIEESEAPAEFWSRMASSDANQDGKIDKTEATQAMRAMATRRGPGDAGRGSDSEKSGSAPGKRGDEANKPGKRGDEAGKPREPRESGAPQGGNGDRMRQLLDRFDKDGKIAIDSLPGPLRERLAKLDTNGDKTLDSNELKGSAAAELMGDGESGMMLERMRRMMQSLDKDGDGKVAIADIPGDFKDRLSKLDKNGDGMLERSEMAELRGLMGDKGTGPGAIQDRMQQMFNQFDKDGDGKVALSELPEMMRERMSKIDGNGDGFIEKSELKDLAGKRPEDNFGDKKPGEGRYGLGGESTAPQAPKRPESDGAL